MLFSTRAAVVLVLLLAANEGTAFGSTATLAESRIVVQHRSVSTHDSAAQRLFDQGLVKRFGKRSFPLYYLERLGRWDAILATPDPTMGKPAAPFRGLAYHYARCLAFAARRQPARAAKERDAYAVIERSFPADERAYLTVERDVLDASVADAGGDRARSVVRLEDALSITDAQPADNYPNCRFPLREWLGKEYLRRGDALSAERVFRADLARDRGNGRSLYGLMLALRARKSGAAAIVEREYRAAWRDVDAPLTASSF
jgi:hypothetical protein